MPSAAPIVVAQTGQFKLTDYNFSRSSVLGLPYIPGASLPNGTRWWVTAEGTLAGEYNGVQVPGQLECKIIQGYPSEKIYGYVQLRSNLHGTPESHRAGQMFTSFILNSTGTDLEFMFYTRDGGFDAFVSGLKIVAYPMADMVEGVDYFYENTPNDGTDVGAPVLTTASGTYSTILQKTYNIQVPGQYLILANCGMNTIQNQSGKIRLLEAGTQIGVDYIKKSHPTVPSTDRQMCHFMEARTLAPAPGNIVYELQGASDSGGSDKKFYQPRIVLIRLGYFETVNVHPNVGGTIQAMHPSWTAARQSTFIPPVDDDYVLVLGNTTHYTPVQGFVANRIRNATAGTVPDDGQATANFFDANIDRATISTVACEPCSVPTTYVLDACGEFPLGNTTMSHGTLVLIGLTPKLEIQLPSLTVTETLDIADSVDGLTPVISQAETLQVSDSVTMVVSGGPVSIPVDHPRFLSADKLAYLQTQIGTSKWTDMLSDISGGASSYAYWMRAVAWKVGGDVTHLNWIKANLSSICNYHVGSWESGALSGGRWIRSAAIIYDLCYNDLTAGERRHLQDFIMGGVYALLNDNTHPAFEDIYNQDWSRNEPDNNYFAGMHQATVYCALALYHDVFGPSNPAPTFSWPPGTGTNNFQWVMPLRKPAHNHTGSSNMQPPLFTDALEYAIARFEQLCIPVWDRKSAGGLVGGGWHEGSWYRPMWAVYDCFKAMQEVAGYTPPMQNINHRDFIYYNLHAPMPGSTRPPEIGDSGSPDVRKSVSSNDRVLMLFLADTYRNEDVGRYAQWWLQNVVTGTSSGDHQWDGYDFFYYDTRITATDYRPIVSKSWLSLANGLVMSRTGWTSTDTFAGLYSEDRIQLHGHAEQNSIQIACGRGGTSDAQFLVGPRCAHGASGENQNDSGHVWNHASYKLAGHNQRASKTESFPGQPDPLPTGNIDRYSPYNGVYTYGQGNASDAYRQGTGFSKTWPPDLKTVDVFLRDFFHFPSPNLVVTYDHIKLRATTPSGSPVAQTVESYMHYTNATIPTHAAGITTIQSGTARCFRTSVFPVGQVEVLTDEDNEGGISYECYEGYCNLPVVSNYSRHLQVFDVTTTSQASMNPTAAITSSDYFEGVSIDDGGTRYHVLFALSQTGSAPSADFYYDVVKLNDNDVHCVANLDPNYQGYLVQESDLGAGVFRYSFSKNPTGFPVDQGGVLSFTPTNLFEGETVTITETAISLTDTVGPLYDLVAIDETPVALTETVGPLFDFLVLNESPIALVDEVSFGEQEEVTIDETAIVFTEEELLITDILDLNETVVLSESSFFFDSVAPISETVTLTEVLSIAEVVAPISASIALADTVSVTEIAPPPPVVPPGTAGSQIDTEVSYDGEIDTEVSL